MSETAITKLMQINGTNLKQNLTPKAFPTDR
jgi:hypothetical protein